MINSYWRWEHPRDRVNNPERNEHPGPREYPSTEEHQTPRSRGPEITGVSRARAVLATNAFPAGFSGLHKMMSDRTCLICICDRNIRGTNSIQRAAHQAAGIRTWRGGVAASARAPRRKPEGRRRVVSLGAKTDRTARGRRQNRSKTRPSSSSRSPQSPVAPGHQPPSP